MRSAWRRHGGHDAQLGIGQGVKAIHPNGIDAGQAVSVNLGGGEFEAAGAHGEAAACQFAVDFLIDGEEGRTERDVGEAAGEAGAIASGGGQLFDGVRQGITEAVEAGDAGKLGAGDALRGLFHQEVKHGGGDFGGACGIVVDEAGEGLDKGDGKYKTFAGEAVLEVLRHGGGGHEEANVGSARVQGLAEKSRIWEVLPEPAGPESKRIGSSVAQGEEITKKAFLAKAQRALRRNRGEEPERATSVRFLAEAPGDVTNIEQSSAGGPDMIKSANTSRTGRPLVTPG